MKSSTMVTASQVCATSRFPTLRADSQSPIQQLAASASAFP